MSFRLFTLCLVHLCSLSYPPVYVLQRVGPSIRSGPSFCPKINATTEGDTEILVPSGSKKAIKVKVENIVVSSGGVTCRLGHDPGAGEVKGLGLGLDLQKMEGRRIRADLASTSEGPGSSVEWVFQSRSVTLSGEARTRM